MWIKMVIPSACRCLGQAQDGWGPMFFYPRVSYKWFYLCCAVKKPEMRCSNHINCAPLLSSQPRLFAPSLLGSSVGLDTQTLNTCVANRIEARDGWELCAHF